MISRPKSIAIVGAGVIGASIAYHLARRGASVTLIEREEPGEGATAASFAWINAAAYHGAEAYYRLRLQSLFEYQRLEDEIGLEVKRGGRLEWRDDPEELADETRTLAALGYPIRQVGRDEVVAFEPELRDPPESAVYAAIEGTVEPRAMTARLLAAAQGLGAAMKTGRAVTGLSLEAGKLRGLETDSGRFKADCIVLAAGVGSADLAVQAEVTLPMANLPGLLIRTAPTKPLLGRVVLAPELHMKQDPDGRIVAGADFGGGPVPTDPWAEGERLVAKMAARLRVTAPPQLENVSIGLRPIPQDGFPIVGFAQGPANLYLAVMHSGITLAPLVGRLAAAEILDQVTVDLLAPYRPGRF